MAQRQFRSDDTDKWLYGFGNGSDGALTISSNTSFAEANAGCSGTSGGASLTLDNASSFANGDLVLIHQTRGTGAGNWELNKIASGGGTTSITLAHNLMNTYTDSGASQAQIVKLRQYSSVTVDNSRTWTGPAWDGNKGGILAFLCNGTTTVNGTISTDGATGVQNVDNARPSGGGFRGGWTQDATNSTGLQGESITGDGSQSTSANGSGGGAGGGNANFNAGGGGSHATAGTSGSGSGANNGAGATAIVGNASLTTMVFGGAGGGATGTAGSNQISATNGGGIVLIISKDIVVTGAIKSNGGSYNFSNHRINGGGGAGGSILLKGQTVALGTSLVTATGGVTTIPDTGEKPGDGGVGRIHVDYSISLSGTTNPTVDSTQDSSIVDASAGGGALLLLGC